MLFLAFIIGLGLGMLTVSLCVVAGDADRCSECMWRNRNDGKGIS